MKRFLIAERNSVIFFIAVAMLIVLFSTALSNMGTDKTEEDRLQLQSAISNAAVSCYAIEGSYPPSIEYLIEHYGIQIDTDRFAVKYERYASNLKPDITVLVNNHEN